MNAMRPRHYGYYQVHHRHRHGMRKSDPIESLQRIEQALAHAPRLVRAERRAAWHIPSGELFTLSLLDSSIIDVQPHSPAGAALAGHRNALEWAEAQDWWMSPPAHAERKSA
jgi:hypothetical protein